MVDADVATPGLTPGPVYGTVFWVFAIGYLTGMAIILGFEIAAFIINSKYTLSDMTWQWEGRGWTAARYLAFFGLEWLALHIAFGWFR